MRLNVVYIFVYKIATINLVSIIKLFYIICKAVLFFLFINRYCDKYLLKLIWIYFCIVEINSCSMFHLHYLVWLKKTLYIPILHVKKKKKTEDFYRRLLVFLKYIIKCFINNNVFFKALYHICFDIYKINITKDFITQF